MEITNIIKLIFLLIFALAGSLLLFIGFRECPKPCKLVKYGMETQEVVIDSYKRPIRGLERKKGSKEKITGFSL